jgi:hypothetical protein
MAFVEAVSKRRKRTYSQPIDTIEHRDGN